MCPGSNQVVNSIRFCFLWKTLEGKDEKEGGSKTLVTSVSSPSINRGTEQSQGNEEDIKHAGRKRRGGVKQVGRERESSRTKKIYGFFGV